MLWGTAGELLEREDELAALEQSLGVLGRGRGSLVIVEGPAGTGKTSLLEATRGLAGERGLPARSCRGTELERGLPFGGIGQLLGVGAVEPDFEDAPPGIDRSLALLGRFRDAVLGEPVALLVDDAQLVDAPSLRFLCHLALHLEHAPLALVLAVRTGEQGPNEELLGELRSNPLARFLRPRPLSSEAIAELVEEACGPDAPGNVAAACARASGGNPFYLTELLREISVDPASISSEAIAHAAPQTVLHMVMARLARCGPDAAAIASALAVLGDDSSLARTAGLAGVTIAAAGAAADRLARAEILAPGEPLRFTHPLVASTLYSDIGAFERATKHAAAAALLAGEGVGDERVAAHLVHAPPAGDQETVELLRSAASIARERGEPATAATLLARALAEQPAEGAGTDLLLELANAEATAGSPAAIPHFERALGSLAEPRARAEACLSFAKTLHHAGEYGRAAELTERGRSEIDASDPLAEPLLSAWIAAAMLHGPLLDPLRELARPLLDRAREGWMPADPGLRSQLAAWIVGRDGPLEIARNLAAAAFDADPLVDGDARGAALGFAAATLVYVDALDEAELQLEHAIEAAEKRGAVVALSIARHFRAYVGYHRGRLVEAVDDAESSLEIYRYGWTESPWSTPVLALAQLQRGDLDAAAAAIELGEAASPERVEHALLLEARALLRLAQGEPARALTDARESGAISEDAFGTKSSRMFDWTRIAALAANAAGRSEEALEWAEEALRRAQSGGTARQLGMAQTAVGAIRGGEEGLDLLEAANRTLAPSRSRLHALEAKLQLGAALRRAGKRSAASEALREALELADRLGVAPAIRRAREELASLGLRPRRAARAGVDSLTPTEQRVAALAAAGRSTREIGGELFVQPKTVENHLTRIYRKLEIAGRSDLTAALDGRADAGSAAAQVDRRAGRYKPHRRGGGRAAKELG